MGDKADMNKANEVRPIFRRLAEVAERTGCAVILIGHLNKAAGGQSAYRGLGSIDFRAAARSVLLIGRVKREPNVRVIIHDKSSLAPEGKPVAFCLDPETGFEWIGEYDITADERLSGAGGNNATKTEQAEKLILVREVLILLDNVWLILVLTISSVVAFTIVCEFSRIRSYTTMVALIE